MYSRKEKLTVAMYFAGLPSSKIIRLWELFPHPDQLKSELSTVDKLLDCRQVALCKKCFTDGYADKYTEKLQRDNILCVTYYSESYPETLRNIGEPPVVLFARGNAKLLKSRCFSVVGTRKLSSYGKRVTMNFTSELARYFTIVSGLAYGADSVAHSVTLDNDGKTIAVLGSGLNNIYPASNKGLADRIVTSGSLIVSEFLPDATPFAYHFPRRNRIVSALSEGLLVTEAPEKSGTLGTVELALEQGKDIYVVPGEIYSAGFKGSNDLIKSMQGCMVTSPFDILRHYNFEERKKVAFQLSMEEQVIVDALSADKMSFDDLMSATGFSVGTLNFLLANLELRSIIAKLPGNFYCLYGGNR